MNRHLLLCLVAIALLATVGCPPRHPPHTPQPFGAHKLTLPPLDTGTCSLRYSSIQHKRHFQIHAIHGDLPVFDHDMLLLYPGRFDAVDGLGCFGYSLDDGIFEIIGRFGADLDDLGNGHRTSPFLSCAYALVMVPQPIFEWTFSNVEARARAVGRLTFEPYVGGLSKRMEMKTWEAGELCYKKRLRSVARGYMSWTGHVHQERP